MIVKCIPSTEGKKPCPMIRTCFARLTDGTITVCGVPLWYAGLIKQRMPARDRQHEIGREMLKEVYDGSTHD